MTLRVAQTCRATLVGLLVASRAAAEQSDESAGSPAMPTATDRAEDFESEAPVVTVRGVRVPREITGRGQNAREAARQAGALGDAARAVETAPDGRHYLEGFDCFAPSAEYDGAAVPCGTSTEGLPVAPIPQLWLTKFSVASQRLRFEAEARGTNFKYYIRVQAPLVPL